MSARIRIGDIWIDVLRFNEALDAIDRLAAAGRGGAVFTPNVDHLVHARDSAAFREAYARADLSLVDGKPLVWTSRLLGAPLPEKISGSDLFLPVLERAARAGHPVFLLGGGPGAAEACAARLQRELGVAIAGTAAPLLGLAPSPEDEALARRIAASGARLLLVCLGSPKAELWIDRARPLLGAAVALSVGAAIDFYLGSVRRAPRWMQQAGLEWLFRLALEPRRLAYRYLVRDPRFLAILVSTLRLPRAQRERAS